MIAIDPNKGLKSLQLPRVVYGWPGGSGRCPEEKRMEAGSEMRWKNLLCHSEELGDPRLVSQTAEGGACVVHFKS